MPHTCLIHVSYIVSTVLTAPAGVQHVWLIQLPHGHAKAAKQQQQQQQQQDNEQQAQHPQGQVQQHQDDEQQRQQHQQQQGQQQHQHQQQQQQQQEHLSTTQGNSTAQGNTHGISVPTLLGDALSAVNHAEESRSLTLQAPQQGHAGLPGVVHDSPSPPQQAPAKKPRLRQGEGKGAATSAPTKAKLARMAAKAAKAGPSQEQLALALMDTESKGVR
jgi:hypothetical protein